MEIIEEIKNNLISNESLLTKFSLIKEQNEVYDEYDSLEEMFLKNEEEKWEEPPLNRFWGIFSDALNIFATEFRKTNIFPSQQYLSEFLFKELKEVELKEKENIENIIDDLNLYGLVNAAIVIFPIYSFGIDNIGLTKELRGWENANFEIEDLLVFTQQNNVEDTKECLEYSKNQFDMSDMEINYELLNHYLRSRPLEWFHKNQLMVCKIHFSSSGYYENEYYLIRHLEKEICKMFLAHTLMTIEKTPSKSKGFSTRLFNNWETKDIKHYLVFTQNENSLKPTCIPIHTYLSNVIEISNLCIDLPVSLKEETLSEIEEVSDFIDKIYSKCVGDLQNNENVFFDRFKRSLMFFAKSYQTKNDEDSILYLAIAFEMLYTNKVKESISKTLCNNIACIFPKSESLEVYKAIKELYNARSGVAHEGQARSCDIDKARKIYYEAFIIVKNLIEDEIIDITVPDPFSSYTQKTFEDIFMDEVGFSPIKAHD